MAYDFETLPARRGTGSLKWDAMLSDNPEVGEDVVPLSVADMEFVTPEPVKRALIDLVESTPLGYTSPTQAFFDACISWQRRRHGWAPEQEWIVTSPGVVPSLYTAVNAFSEPGDGIIIQPPVYYPFSMAVEQTGRTLVKNPLIRTAEGYRIDFAGLDRLAHERTAKAIILCSPHNPVGRVWTADELRRMLDICTDAGLYIICDEIHNDLVMPGYEHRTLLSLASAEQARRILVCTSCSKTFSLAGTQGSVIYIPHEQTRERYQAAYAAQGLFQLNAFAYPALIAAYNECAGWLDALIGVIVRNVALLEARLNGRLGGLSVEKLEGTYLPWVDFSAWRMDAEEREMFLHREAQLYLDSGRLFGDEGAQFERFNVACPTWVLEAALDRLEAAWRTVRTEGR